MSTHSKTDRVGPRQSAAAVVLLLSLVMLGLSAQSFAVPGDLDPTFNSDGIAGFDLTDIPSLIGLPAAPDEARAVITQPDGKVVVAGYASIQGDDDFALLRYNPDGNLDPSFGFNGIVTTHFGALTNGGNPRSNERINALVLQPDGKLVAAGFTDVFPANGLDLALVRYNVDGSLDSTFDSNGLTLGGVPGNDAALALVRQPADGRLVVAGFTDLTGSLDVAVARFEPDGALDQSFGPGGGGVILVRSVSGAAEVARALVRQPDGRLVVAGYTNAGGSDDFVLFRINPDGNSLDTSFFNTGGTQVFFGTNRQDQANALVLQDDGRLVAGGSSFDGAESDFALVRLNPDGVLDAGFGFGGGLLTSFGPGSISETRALVLQPDGKLVEGGTALVDSDIDFALVRHNSDGSLDPTFGFGGGTLTLLNPGSADFIFALAAQTDGNLVAAGTSIIPNNPSPLGTFNFAAARYEVGPIGPQRARAERRSMRALTPGSVSCKGHPVTILGTPGDDMLRGTIGDDVIHGTGGNDQIFGFDGNDIICGGTGNDQLVGGNGNDRLFGQGGNDRLFGQAGRDNLDGGPGRDRCNPGPGGRRSLKDCERGRGRAPADPTPPPLKRFRLNTFAAGATATPPPIRSSAGTNDWELRGLSEALERQ